MANTSQHESAKIEEYASLATVNEYAAARGERHWLDASETVRGQAAVKAADWMDGLSWKGSRTSREQSHAWPRRGVRNAAGILWPENTLPQEVVRAYCAMCCVFAAVSAGCLEDPLAPVGERNRAVRSRSVDSITVQYADVLAAPLPRNGSVTGFPLVDGLLEGLLSTVNGGSVCIGRG